MGEIVHKNQPCLSPKCGSSDARQVYADGTSFCFSCESFFGKAESDGITPVISSKKSPNIVGMRLEQIAQLPHRGFQERQITKVIAEFFDVRVEYNTDGEICAHYYPYPGQNYKVRRLPKEFSMIGNVSHSLFGMDKFQSGGKRVVITEGEIDAMSVAQANMDKYGRIYPVVAMPSAVGKKALLENRDWLRSFTEVILMLDQDEAGQNATEEAIKIIGIDKVKIAKLPLKDPNEVLLKQGAEKLIQCMWDSSKYIPSGIITKEEIWDALVNYAQIPVFPYPPCLDGLNTKLKGMRQGEITLFVSGTGAGKTTMLREIILHILEKEHADAKVGIVSLEEAPAETARNLAAMYLRKNSADIEIPIEELKIGFDAVFAGDRIVVLDHQGSIDDGSIISKLEYMCLSGCKYLFIDHITILVSEGTENLSGLEAQDKVMNDLLRLTKRHNVWIGLVSHLRKAPVGGKAFEEGRLPSMDDVRGSGSIKQISFDIVAFARNMIAENEVERNTIKMQVLKARKTGLTGQVNGAIYDLSTGRLVYGSSVNTEYVSIGG